jgi:hypothetical protein
MTDKIFFFHNPKAGGSSLRKVFEGYFPAERRCPIIENDKIGHERLRGEYASFRGYDYYAGHYGHDISKQYMTNTAASPIFAIPRRDFCLSIIISGLW